VSPVIRRGFVLKLHLWLALITGAPLTVVALSGSALGIADLVSGGGGVTPRHIEIEDRTRPLDEVLRAARDAYPDRPLAGVALPIDRATAYDVVQRDGRRIFVDPYRLRVMDSMYLTGTLRRRLYEAHATLLAGRIGRTIVGASTLIAMVLVLSGLWLWWPGVTRLRRGLVVKLGAPRRRLIYDLHNVVGFYSSVFLLLLAWSGVVIAYDTAGQLLTRLDGDMPAMPPAKSASAPPGAEPITPGKALAIADVALPGAAARWISFPPSATGLYTVFKQFPEDRSPSGMSRVYIEQYSGVVRGVKSTRMAGAGQRLLDLNFPIHTGTILGGVGQLMAIIASACFGMQFVTGVLVWWKRGS
jgi:uncharacterized iron-regulated membrane protein